jgi:hypothetical protein
MAVPYTFATATTTLPLSQLDTNFAYFGNAITVAATSTSMTIDSSGNVGIGTSSPASRLEVVGANVLVKSTSSSGYAGFYANAATGNAAYNFFGINGTETARIFSDAGNGIYFGTGSSGTERMRIDSSGNLLVGTTSTLNSAKLTIVQTGQTNVVNRNSATAAGKFWNSVYIDSSNSCLIINQNNVGVYVADGATAWSANSDERLKDIIAPITSALEGVQSLRAVRYSWKADSDKSSHVGLIAQDVQKILPETVHSSKLPMSEDETEYLSVAYTEVIPLLVAAIQELSAKNDALETRLAALEAK